MKQAAPYYGLTLVGKNRVEYEGPLRAIPLPGADAAGFIEQLPPCHFLIHWQLGLVIAISSSTDFVAFNFNSPIPVSTGADITSSLLLKGRTISVVEKYAAIEVNRPG